jgi:hypothetical protein
MSWIVLGSSTRNYNEFVEQCELQPEAGNTHCKLPLLLMLHLNILKAVSDILFIC